MMRAAVVALVLLAGCAPEDAGGLVTDAGTSDVTDAGALATPPPGPITVTVTYTHATEADVDACSASKLSEWVVRREMSREEWNATQSDWMFWGCGVVTTGDAGTVDCPAQCTEADATCTFGPAGQPVHIATYVCETPPHIGMGWKRVSP